MRILIVVCEYRDIFKSRIVQRLPQKLAVMGEPAVSHVLAHAYGHIIGIVFPAF